MAAMGDSLTAGFGLKATVPLQVFVENRGLSGFAGNKSIFISIHDLPHGVTSFRHFQYLQVEKAIGRRLPLYLTFSKSSIQSLSVTRREIHFQPKGLHS